MIISECDFIPVLDFICIVFCYGSCCANRTARQLQTARIVNIDAAINQLYKQSPCNTNTITNTNQQHAQQSLMFVFKNANTPCVDSFCGCVDCFWMLVTHKYQQRFEVMDMHYHTYTIATFVGCGYYILLWMAFYPLLICIYWKSTDREYHDKQVISKLTKWIQLCEQSWCERIPIRVCVACLVFVVVLSSSVFIVMFHWLFVVYCWK